MKISVIVPYWNSEKWLERCCTSLTRQTGDVEFILVDDHSTDRGKDIVYEYCDKDARFRAVTNQRTKGVSGARNTGLDLADGEWITFLDADDELLDEAGDRFRLCAEAYGAAKVIQFNHYRYYPTIDKLAFKYFNSAGIYGINKLPQIWFGVWNKLFKADFVKDLRYDEDLQYGEDGLFVLECLAKGAYIQHAHRDTVTVKHNFINMGSLSRSKDAEGLLKQVHAYEDFMMRQTDPEIRVAVCQELSRLWGSDTYAKCIGEGK